MDVTNDFENLSNLEIFELVAGKIFAQLFEEFPMKRGLFEEPIAVDVIGSELYWKPSAFLEADGTQTYVPTELGYKIKKIIFASIAWLEETGFILRHPTEAIYVLSPKALEALARVPDVLKAPPGTKPLGKQIVSAAAGVGKIGGRVAMSDLVHQAITWGAHFIPPI